MSNDGMPDVERGENGITSMSSSGGKISGPLGIWPFPILNALFSNSRMTVTEIRRDDDGRIQGIEEYEL